MKVLHLNDHYEQVGGAESILFHTLGALEERGIVNVVVHQHPTKLKETRRHVYQVPHMGDVISPKSSRVAVTFREILDKERPDLIHLYDIGNPDIAEMSCRYGPTVQSVLNHSFYCPGGGKYLPFLGRTCLRPLGPGCLASAFLTHCNSVRPHILFSSYLRSTRMLRRKAPLLFLALSHYQADCLFQSGYPADRVKVLPPFTDLPELSATTHSLSREATLLFTGRIVPGKGLDVLLRALPYVRSSFRLLVDGAGSDFERTKTLALKLGLGDRVQFVGWSPPEQHQANYLQASIVLVPSTWPEPFGLVGIEGMSYTKPVVAFRVGGIPDWLEDGTTGFLIPPGDLKGMAEKIDFLLQNPKTAHQMGEMGRKKVEAEFSKEVYMRRLLEIYNGLLPLPTRF